MHLSFFYRYLCVRSWIFEVNGVVVGCFYDGGRARSEPYRGYMRTRLAWVQRSCYLIRIFMSVPVAFIPSEINHVLCKHKTPINIMREKYGSRDRLRIQDPAVQNNVRNQMHIHIYP